MNTRLNKLREEERVATAAKLSSLDARIAAAPASGGNAMLKRTERIRKANREELSIKLSRLETDGQRKERLAQAPAPAVVKAPKKAFTPKRVANKQVLNVMARRFEKQMEKQATSPGVPAQVRPIAAKPLSLGKRLKVNLSKAFLSLK